MQNKNNKTLTRDQETIVALCSPMGSGAIALIRLSGKDAIIVADRIALLSSKKKLSSCPTHTIHHGHVIQTNEENPVDEVLFFLMHGPKTFTGQDTVEISCHNNPFIINKIIELSIQQGARTAQPGEFTQRAFLNNKIDLLQAESINEIIHAQSEHALSKAMAQLKGSLSSYFHAIEQQLVELTGFVEATFEFLEEEEQDLALNKQVKKRLQEALMTLKNLKQHFNKQQQIKDGIRIALIGSVNAGKSTLFNALLKKERAIVTDIPGTTRDSIEQSKYIHGNFWLFTDTAGLRSTDDMIEQQGIERSLEQAAYADIILLVFDAARSMNKEEQFFYQKIYENYKQKIVIIANKTDQIDYYLPTLFETETVINISAKDRIGIDNVELILEKKTQELLSHLQSPFLLNQRQYRIITEIEQKLENIANSYSSHVGYELIAYDLKEILEHLCQLTGKNITEDIMDQVFSNFCVGK